MKRIVHFKLFLLVFALSLTMSSGQAQTGIGVAGTLYFPGFFTSDLYNSRFGLGGGYELFARHRLFKINPDIVFHARYNYRRYYDSIRLPSVGTTNFNFTYLSLSLISPLKHYDKVTIYCGAGFSMATVTSLTESYYFNKVAEASLLPDLISGIEFYLGKNYNVFAELCFQYGRVRVQRDIIPLSGMRISIGTTMFLISD